MSAEKRADDEEQAGQGDDGGKHPSGLVNAVFHNGLHGLAHPSGLAALAGIKKGEPGSALPVRRQDQLMTWMTLREDGSTITR